MSELISELKNIYDELLAIVESFEKAEIAGPLDALENSANQVEKAWGHSWLGYQAYVYYEGLKPPPPGAHFSSEWGFKGLHTMGTRGNWQQFPEDVVEAEIKKR